MRRGKGGKRAHTFAARGVISISISLPSSSSRGLMIAFRWRVACENVRFVTGWHMEASLRILGLGGCVRGAAVKKLMDEVEVACWCIARLAGRRRRLSVLARHACWNNRADVDLVVIVS